MLTIRILPSLAAAMGLASGLFLSGCDRAEDQNASLSGPVDRPGPGSATAFEKELAGLKSENVDPEKKAEAIRSLLHRYGHEVPARPEAELPGPVTEASAPLGKTAANTLFTVKKVDFQLPFAMQQDFTVKNGETLEAWTKRTAAQNNVDPVILGFYSTNTAQGGIAFTFNVVGWNDDDPATGGMDSYFSWKNTTGATRVVRVMAYAYNSDLGGAATLVARNNGSWSYNGIMRGQLQYDDNLSPQIPSSCSAPSVDILSMERVYGGGFRNGVVAVNLDTKKGGYILEEYSEDNLAQVLTLKTALTPGWPSFLLMFTLKSSGFVYESTKFRVRQNHVVNCP